MLLKRIIISAGDNTIATEDELVLLANEYFKQFNLKCDISLILTTSNSIAISYWLLNNENEYVLSVYNVSIGEHLRANNGPSCFFDFLLEHIIFQ